MVQQCASASVKRKESEKPPNVSISIRLTSGSLERSSVALGASHCSSSRYRRSTERKSSTVLFRLAEKETYRTGGQLMNHLQFSYIHWSNRAIKLSPCWSDAEDDRWPTCFSRNEKKMLEEPRWGRWGQSWTKGKDKVVKYYLQKVSTLGT